jgi:hypothetical protein
LLLAIAAAAHRLGVGAYKYPYPGRRFHDDPLPTDFVI